MKRWTRMMGRVGTRHGAWRMDNAQGDGLLSLFYLVLLAVLTFWVARGRPALNKSPCMTTASVEPPPKTSPHHRDKPKPKAIHVIFTLDPKVGKSRGK
ncbi:hypothetical protein L210DRAFT_3767597, partial [Boletus edulis BED1]